MGYTHQQTQEHCLPATHYLVLGELNTCLTCHVEILIVQQRALLLLRVSARSGRLLRRSLCGGFFRTLQLQQQCLIVLQICSASMKAQNAQEDILIARTACHRLDEVDVRVLWLVLSELPNIIILQTLCKMLCALSKFLPPFSPHLSGRLLFKRSNRSTAISCRSARSVSEI